MFGAPSENRILILRSAKSSRITAASSGAGVATRVQHSTGCSKDAMRRRFDIPFIGSIVSASLISEPQHREIGAMQLYRVAAPGACSRICRCGRLRPTCESARGGAGRQRPGCCRQGPSRHGRGAGCGGLLGLVRSSCSCSSPRLGSIQTASAQSADWGTVKFFSTLQISAASHGATALELARQRPRHYIECRQSSGVFGQPLRVRGLNWGARVVELSISVAGDRNLLARLGSDASLDVNFLVLGFVNALQTSPIDAITDLIPSYNSVLGSVRFHAHRLR